VTTYMGVRLDIPAARYLHFGSARRVQRVDHCFRQGLITVASFTLTEA